MAGKEVFNAPALFAQWMSGHTATDKKFGRKVFRYHPRSDDHSKMLCTFVLHDLLAACPLMADHVDQRRIVGGINVRFRFANGKKKTLDLAFGTPAEPTDDSSAGVLARGKIDKLRFSCEAKQCMTEHGKTKPRIFDELSSSHEIVHQGDREAIAAEIVVVNISERYASPTRQVSGKGELIWSHHRQPHVTESMVQHLRGLLIRDAVNETGFDAFATIVIESDNVRGCTLHTHPPAPQPGDRDHYSTLLRRISDAYSSRYG